MPNSQTNKTAQHVVRLSKAQLEALRVPGERGFLRAIFGFNLLLGISCVSAILAGLPDSLPVASMLAGGALFVWVSGWLSWKFLYWFVYGNSVRVTEAQYPSIYLTVRQASEALQLRSMPAIFVLQGHGLLELFVARRFSRRGMIIITSNLLDDLAVSGDTRRIMMVVGRQLGHIAAGHFEWWFFRDLIGALTIVLHKAYRRRCHLTADRIGLLVAGDLQESQAALLTLTVGKTLAPSTNLEGVREQCAELSESFFAWLGEVLDNYPYMIARIAALQEFYDEQQAARIRGSDGQPVQVLSIAHYHLTGVTIGTQVIGDSATVTVAAA